MITKAGFNFLSELYAADAPDAWLLPEYPSSNSDETRFQNRDRFIIHDPFPPPPRELLQVLGPHHLMCGWGSQLAATSQVQPPAALIDHWERVLGKDVRPVWKPFDESREYITLFPHESLNANQQVVDPEVNYAIHSKEVIEKIDCQQADVLPEVKPPCVAKLSHGYAGLGNFFINSNDDAIAMRQKLDEQWPSAKLVVNSLIENINGDFGVQFYLRKSGEIVWLGFTEQKFDKNRRWCGGTFTASMLDEMLPHFEPFIEAAGAYLHSVGYFGVVGIDLLRDTSNQFYLVDVNPRLTGISPFLIASRIFARDGHTNGIYRASCRFDVSPDELIAKAEQTTDAKLLVLSAVQNSSSGQTIAHVSASSTSIDTSVELLGSL